MLISRLNELMDNPQLAGDIFTRVYTQEMELTGSSISSSKQVDEAFSFVLTGVTALATYEDGTAITESKYLPLLNIKDGNSGVNLNGGDAINRNFLKDNIEFSNLSPVTLGGSLREIFPIIREFPNKGIIETAFTRTNINSAPGKSILKININYIGINIRNTKLEV